MRTDVIIIGGSFAGLSAAMYLGRARRTVSILDTHRPRNRFAARSHGFFGHDGDSPAAMLATARSQVAAYPTTRFVNAEAVRAGRETGGFAVTLGTGETLHAAMLVLAFGISDELPDVPGLAERWGSSVLHCPYCHGYEFSGKRLGVLNVTAMSVHQAMLIAEWGPTTLYLDGAAEPDAATLAQLRRHGVTIERAPVKALHGDGVQLSAVELRDGRMLDADALYVGPRTKLNSEIAKQLGCAMEEGPFGEFIRTDVGKLTTVAGVYAAGDITRASHNLTWASADGVTAGLAVHRALVFDD